jgi:hypothetical protein
MLLNSTTKAQSSKLDKEQELQQVTLNLVYVTMSWIKVFAWLRLRGVTELEAYHCYLRNRPLPPLPVF